MGARKSSRRSLRFALSCLLIIGIYVAIGFGLREPLEPIRIGALHSLTGTMASSEIQEVETLRALVAATNRQGGLLGRPLELIIADGASDPSIFARHAESLIKEQAVSVIFGCWLSSARKAVKPVIERYDSLLMYPAQHEGLERSEHIIYAGATPNQQLFPSLIWAQQTFGNKLFLVGSDYVYPKSLNLITRILAPKIGLEVINERYLDLVDHDAAKALAEEIVLSGADFVLNSINGDGNEAFFRAMDQIYGTKPNKPLPAVISLSLDENAARSLPNLQGHSYLSWSYIYNPEHWIQPNDPVIADALSHELSGYPISATMAATIISYTLWRTAVEHIGTPQPRAVNASIRNRGIRLLGGHIFADPETGHLYQFSQIAAHQNRIPLPIVWESDSVIPPEPYPLGFSVTEWERMLHKAKAE
ncbi:transporter substrate-binding protein [uncultured Marinobacter sp.]|uniref:transporter substrate-binding protein n=1 Tax=uncultured Marinobacter sp. TaxID=187379 RepID=UPI00261E5650|nr:transporter substrate-binding protein [uncultured Marinobacter sp.]